MKLLKSLFILLISCSLIISGCKKDEIEDPIIVDVTIPSSAVSLAPFIGTWGQKALVCEFNGAEAVFQNISNGFRIDSAGNGSVIQFSTMDTFPRTITRFNDTLFFSPDYLGQSKIAWEFSGDTLVLRYRTNCFSTDTFGRLKHIRI